MKLSYITTNAFYNIMLKRFIGIRILGKYKFIINAKMWIFKNDLPTHPF